MDEKNVTKKVSKKEARRKRNMRNTIMMAVICVLLLSGATYAWFTLSNTARVSNLTLKVGEAGGLQIAEPDGENAGTWGSFLRLGNMSENIRLLPAIMLESSRGTIYKPGYNDSGEVSETKALTPDESMEYATGEQTKVKNVYKITKTFYLRTLQGANTNKYSVFLSQGRFNNNDITGEGYFDGNTDSLKGTYVICNKKDQSVTGQGNSNTLLASNAIRIYFENQSLSSDNTGLYCPNSEVTSTGGTGASVVQNGDEDFYGDIAIPTINQKSTGVFTNTPDGKTYSTELFKIKGGGEENRIVMTIWLEGDDEQCVNEVALDSIIAQIQFTLAE